MATFTWILLMLFVQQTHCRSTRKDRSHHHHHTNAKKSFLADAMKEMEYGENAAAKARIGKIVQNGTEAVAPQENNHISNKHKHNHTIKNIVNGDYFVARIFPSKVITEVSKKTQDKAEKDKKHGDQETPKLQGIHTGDETPKNKDSIKINESLSQNVSTPTIAPSSSLQPRVVVSSSITQNITNTSSNNSKSETEKVEVEKSNQGGKKKGPKKNIKDAIRLLQAFVEKLLKENETNESSNHSSKAKPTIKQSEKKDVLKQALPIHVRPHDGQQSTVISGIKYNLAPVYRLKAKLSKDAVNNNSSPEQQQEQQQKQQEPQKQPEQQQGQQEEQKKQNQEIGSQQQHEQQQQNNIQNKLQGDIEKLKQEETALRQSLAEKELEIQKLKLQNSPSVSNASSQVVESSTQTPNITKQDESSSNDDHKHEESSSSNDDHKHEESSSSNDNQKHEENSSSNDDHKHEENSSSNDDHKHEESSSSNDDQKELKFASLKGVPPELLMKLKNILEEKRRKSQKFVSKQEVHSRKAFETARKLVKAALAREQLYKAEQDFFEKVKEMMNKTSTANLVKDNENDQNESTINNDEGSTIKDYIQRIEEQSLLEDKERRTNPSPSPLPKNNVSSITTKSLNDSMSNNTGLQGRNSSQGAVALDLQASAAKILKQLNHTKGPDEKNVEAAAHLEEKVAEQQDEMYEKLIRQTLGKGMGGDDEDDEEDDEENAEARNMNGESRPPEQEMMGRQENYGDFQDSDEEAQSRSDIKYVDRFNKDESLPSIEEDSLLSLRDKISRPKMTL